MKRKNIKTNTISLVIAIMIVVGIFCFYRKTHNENVVASSEEKTGEQIKVTEKYKFLNPFYIANIDESKINEKVALLTIDDGPTKRTLGMMDVLNKHDVKAIFFLNGYNVNKKDNTMKILSENGFSLGNHSFSHRNLKTEKDVNIINEEIDREGGLIERASGSLPRFFRAPYRESNKYLKDLVKEKGMIFVDWSSAASDWEKVAENEEIFVGNVMKELKPGSIILIHEYPWTLTNLDALIIKIKESGYTLVDPRDIVE